jgi:hypothetical protein
MQNGVSMLSNLAETWLSNMNILLNDEQSETPSSCFIQIPRKAQKAHAGVELVFAHCTSKVQKTVWMISLQHFAQDLLNHPKTEFLQSVVQFPLFCESDGSHCPPPPQLQYWILDAVQTGNGCRNAK